MPPALAASFPWGLMLEEARLLPGAPRRWPDPASAHHHQVLPIGSPQGANTERALEPEGGVGFSRFIPPKLSGRWAVKEHDFYAFWHPQSCLAVLGPSGSVGRDWGEEVLKELGIFVCVSPHPPVPGSLWPRDFCFSSWRWARQGAPPWPGSRACVGGAWEGSWW